MQGEKAAKSKWGTAAPERLSAVLARTVDNTVTHYDGSPAVTGERSVAFRGAAFRAESPFLAALARIRHGRRNRTISHMRSLYTESITAYTVSSTTVSSTTVIGPPAVAVPEYMTNNSAHHAISFDTHRTLDFLMRGNA